MVRAGSVGKLMHVYWHTLNMQNAMLAAQQFIIAEAKLRGWDDQVLRSIIGIQIPILILSRYLLLTKTFKLSLDLLTWSYFPSANY